MTTTGTEKEYYGEEGLPAWVQDGVKVEVRSTPALKKYGIIYSSRVTIWSGERGVIYRYENGNIWCWKIKFTPDSKGNRDVVLDCEIAEEIQIYKTKAKKYNLRDSASRELGLRRTSNGWE